MPQIGGEERAYRGDLWLLNIGVSAISVNPITLISSLILLPMCTLDEGKALGLMILMSDRGRRSRFSPLLLFAAEAARQTAGRPHFKGWYIDIGSQSTAAVYSEPRLCIGLLTVELRTSTRFQERQNRNQSTSWAAEKTSTINVNVRVSC